MENTKEAIIWSYEIIGLEEKKQLQSLEFNELKQRFSSYLNHLIEKDFNRLISILYRIDIPREKISAALSNNSDERTAGEILTDLIIARQMEKIKTRKAYRENSEIIPGKS